MPTRAAVTSNTLCMNHAPFYDASRAVDGESDGCIAGESCQVGRELKIVCCIAATVQARRAGTGMRLNNQLITRKVFTLHCNNLCLSCAGNFVTVKGITSS